MAHSIAIFLVRFRGWLFLASIVLTVGLLAGLGHLKLESGMRLLFPANDPHLQAYDAMQEEYIKSDSVFLLVGKKSGESIFDVEALSAIEALTEKSWRLPYSLRVDSLSNFQHTRAENDQLTVRPLVEQANKLSPADMEAVRGTALRSRELVHSLVDPEGTVGGVLITFNLPEAAGQSSQAIKEIMGAVLAMKQDVEQAAPGVDIYVQGKIPFDYTFLQLSEMDGAFLVPVMYLVIGLVIFLSVRSFSAVIVTFSVITFTLLAVLGLLGHLGIPLNQVTVTAPTIFMTLAVCDSVHLYNVFLRNYRNGMDKRSAIEHSLEKNLVPVFLTSLTTAIGFWGMNFADSPPFRQLGTITTIGVVFALVFSLFLVPALAVVLPTRAGKKQVTWTGFAPMLARWGVSRSGVTLSLTALVTLLSVYGVSRLLVDDDAISYFKEKVPFHVAADYMEAHLPGFEVLEYSVETGTPAGVNDPAFLRSVDAFVAWLESQPEVTFAGAYSKVVKRLNETMHNDEKAWYVIPQTREEAAQLMLLYELSLPFGLDLNNQINFDRSAVRVTVKVKDIRAEELLRLHERIEQQAQAQLKEYGFKAGSLSLMFAHYGLANIASMLWGSISVLLVVSLILVFAFKSLRTGFISLVPNLFPALIIFGLWGYFVGHVNVSAAIIFSITLGIIVDDTIHITAHFMDQLKAGTDVVSALERTMIQVGPSVISTSAILAAGFSVFVVSDFMVTVYTGVMVSGTIIAALLFDVMVLPALLMRLTPAVNSSCSKEPEDKPVLTDSSPQTSFSDVKYE